MIDCAVLYLLECVTTELNVILNACISYKVFGNMKTAIYSSFEFTYLPLKWLSNNSAPIRLWNRSRIYLDSTLSVLCKVS
jgi:hypothetical protein